MSDQSSRFLVSLQCFEWRDIPGFTGYRAGDNGTIWSCRTRKGLGRGKGTAAYLRNRWRRLESKPHVRSNHHTVTLFKNGKRHYRFVHRLVLEAFVGPCPTGMEACHFPDRNPNNNCVENIRWDTRKNNSADSKIHGTRPQGEKNGSAKLTEWQVREIKKMLQDGIPQRTIAREFGITQTAVGYIHRGRLWNHVALEQPTIFDKEDEA
jgi:HNH endonuclease